MCGEWLESHLGTCEVRRQPFGVGSPLPPSRSWVSRLVTRAFTCWAVSPSRIVLSRYEGPFQPLSPATHSHQRDLLVCSVFWAIFCIWNSVYILWIFSHRQKQYTDQPILFFPQLTWKSLLIKSKSCVSLCFSHMIYLTSFLLVDVQCCDFSVSSLLLCDSRSFPRAHIKKLTCTWETEASGSLVKSK